MLVNLAAHNKNSNSSEGNKFEIIYLVKKKKTIREVTCQEQRSLYCLDEK